MIIAFSYAYFTLYGRSLNSRDIQDSQYRIALPTVPSKSGEQSTASGSDAKKALKPKGQGKKPQQNKAAKIIEENKQRKLEKRAENETEKLTHLESQLTQIPAHDSAQTVALLDAHLVSIELAEHRLELLEQKFRAQRKWMQSLRTKSNLTNEEASQLELLHVGYFATMAEMVQIKNIDDTFEAMKKFMEELVKQRPLDRDGWYRFQLAKINSRLPRREQGTRDGRVPNFIPDQWQVAFLDAVDKRESIIIVAPTASG